MRHWTQEERQRQSQLIQNWKPWKKSTGAKTTEGKAISKMNAYKTGWHTSEFREIRKLFREHDNELADIRLLSNNIRL